MVEGWRVVGGDSHPRLLSNCFARAAFNRSQYLSYHGNKGFPALPLPSACVCASFCLCQVRWSLAKRRLSQIRFRDECALIHHQRFWYYITVCQQSSLLNYKLKQTVEITVNDCNGQIIAIYSLYSSWNQEKLRSYMSEKIYVYCIIWNKWWKQKRGGLCPVGHVFFMLWFPSLLCLFVLILLCVSAGCGLLDPARSTFHAYLLLIVQSTPAV